MAAGDLSSDANLAFSDDIEGEGRLTDNWDIGAIDTAEFVTAWMHVHQLLFRVRNIDHRGEAATPSYFTG